MLGRPQSATAWAAAGVLAGALACTSLDGLTSASGDAADASAVADAAVEERAGPPSCRTLATRCGPQEDVDCCEAPALPGGTYNRLNDPAFPASVSPFRLDRFEVVVGRFRRWMETLATADRDILRPKLACDPRAPWTDAPGPNEYVPITCVLRTEAIDFCAWDGARLQTEAEWNFAAAGGDEQRYFPWSVPGTSQVLDATHGVWIPPLARVGSRPLGAGRWGHFDLSGNAYELVMDLDGPLPVPCKDCVVDAGTPGRIMHRGGSVSPDVDAGTRFWSTTFRDGDPNVRNWNQGFRCAR